MIERSRKKSQEGSEKLVLIATQKSKENQGNLYHEARGGRKGQKAPNKNLTKKLHPGAHK